MTQDFDHDRRRSWIPTLCFSCQRCLACDLAANRQNVVVWRGNIKAPLMIIGEGRAEEDEQGYPLSGGPVNCWINCSRPGRLGR